MVSDAAQWRWSSYGAMVGANDAPDWLQTDWILGQFESSRQAAIARYIDFVRAGVGLPSIWSELRNQVFLGDEAFAAQAQAATDKQDVTEIPRTQRRTPANHLANYRQAHSDMKAAMALAYASGDYTMHEIARHFGVHYSTVSRAVRNHSTVDWGATRAGDCKT